MDDQKDPQSDNRSLIAHVIFRLDVGGLENGLVNLINHLPDAKFRHAVICIDRSTDFRKRIKRPDVEIVEIRKKAGKDWSAYWRLYKVIKRLSPDILHTRNIGALDALAPAMLAGVKIRIHGEHGWDINDIDGSSRKLRWVRRVHRPLVSHYVALSKGIEGYLIESLSVDTQRISRICNGVDTTRFFLVEDRARVRQELQMPFARETIVFGTVGRLTPVKNQLLFVEAFASVVRKLEHSVHLGLAIVGDGELRNELEQAVSREGISEFVWFAGARPDIPSVMQALDVFVLPSLAEGISNTILEAMASQIPVITTDVGGNSQLVVHGETGMVVQVKNSPELQKALVTYASDAELRERHGFNGRRRTEEQFSIETMIRHYDQIYDQLLQQSKSHRS